MHPLLIASRGNGIDDSVSGPGSRSNFSITYVTQVKSAKIILVRRAELSSSKSWCNHSRGPGGCSVGVGWISIEWVLRLAWLWAMAEVTHRASQTEKNIPQMFRQLRAGSTSPSMECCHWEGTLRWIHEEAMTPDPNPLEPYTYTQEGRVGNGVRGALASTARFSWWVCNLDSSFGRYWCIYGLAHEINIYLQHIKQ